MFLALTKFDYLHNAQVSIINDISSETSNSKRKVWEVNMSKMFSREISI